MQKNIKWCGCKSCKIPKLRYETNLKKRWDIKGANEEGDEDCIQLGEEKNQLWWKVSINRKHKELTRHGKYGWENNYGVNVIIFFYKCNFNVLP